MKATLLAAFSLIGLLTLPPAFAGTPLASPDKQAPPLVPTPVPLTTYSLKSSYTFESDFERGRNASGDAWWNEVEVGHRFPISLSWPSGEGGWYLRLGANYTNFNFDNAGNLPLPGVLQSFSAVIALEYLRQGNVGILIETQPGFYFENTVTADAFDAPTKLAAVFPITDRFFLIGGLAYSSLRSYPLLPIVGAYWRINDQWTLRAVVPEPRLVYGPSERLAFFVGGEVAGGSYRTADNRTRRADLREAALTYSEWRFGGGFTYGDADRCALELGAGYTFSRSFDYARADEEFTTDGGAPYVKLSFRGGF